MKNLILSGLLFLSPAAFAQTTNLDEPDIVVDSISGTADGFSVRNGDDHLDFGLVIPTLTKTQVMDFNLSYVLSSETSVIRAVGQRINVPSNLSLPKQNERYSFFTIRIDKPDFKLPIATEELPSEIVVLEGGIPFGRTVDTLRSGKPLFSVINSFTFESYSIAPITNPEDSIEVSVGANLIDGEVVEFISPFEEDPDFVSLGLNMTSFSNENSETRYFPVDVKTLERPQFLTTDQASETTPVVVSVPTAVFDSATEASAKPFPFTMVWGEAAPTNSLPLAKTFMETTLDDTGMNVVEIDYDQISNVSAIGLTAVFTDDAGNELSSLTSVGAAVSGITSVSIPDNTKRIRLDVYAIDADPIKASIIVENTLTEADILKEAKYITRYEEDLN